jgi:hypothetical protein
MQIGSGVQLNEALRNAYRTTFQEYARKLEALQKLMNDGLTNSGTADAARLDAAVLEVEQARIAHNAARDRLAKELVRPALPPATGNPATGSKEHRIRQTARLLWEMAGRPDGTAEHDWRRAEQLVRQAATSSC